MGQTEMLVREELENNASGKGRRIIDSLFEGCEDWQCKKCGMSSRGSEYHHCGADIMKTVCEYCKNYTDGMCTLRD